MRHLFCMDIYNDTIYKKYGLPSLPHGGGI
jgi:hypothetical protein